MTIGIDLSKHLLAVFNRNLILVIHPKHIAETDNSIQWGAQGVTDISQKDGLQLLRLLRTSHL